MIDSISQVMVMDLTANRTETHVFDYIFVCNGHNSEPLTPEFEGASEFQGHIMHSHDYRRADTFKGSLFKFNGFSLNFEAKTSEQKLYRKL